MVFLAIFLGICAAVLTWFGMHYYNRRTTGRIGQRLSDEFDGHVNRKSGTRARTGVQSAEVEFTVRSDVRVEEDEEQQQQQQQGNKPKWDE